MLAAIAIQARPFHVRVATQAAAAEHATQSSLLQHLFDERRADEAVRQAILRDIEAAFTPYAASEGVRLPAAALLVADKLADKDPQKKVVVDYSRKYQEKTKQAVSTFGGHAYDGLMILVGAMQRAKTADKAKIRDEIEKTKGYVGTGGIVTMSPTDHMGLDLSAFRMLEIKKGDWTLVPESGS